MQTSKYWRNNNLRYRMEGIVQNKVERKSKVEPVKLPDASEKTKQPVISKADVA